MILKFNVKEQTISLVNTKSVPRIGSKDYLVLQFSFSSDWENLNKLVYLQSGDVSQPIDTVDNLVEVPEWFTEQDSFNVTLFGTDGTTEVPTNVVSVQLEKSNDLWVKDAPEPQPSWLVSVLDAAELVKEATVHGPTIGSNGNWYTWDFESKQYIDTGVAASGGSGTTDHTKLTNRNADDQHPMSAITGLVGALDGKMDSNNPVGTGSFSMGRKDGSVIGTDSHAEGTNTTAFGESSHAEGRETTASGYYSHTEGLETTASGPSSHAEGYITTASGQHSHAEGQNTIASGDNSHAEGMETIAGGHSSHAEGYITTASGHYSHAEGQNTTASGQHSHAEGLGTKASSVYQHTQGTFNIKDSSGTYAHIVGNGIRDTARSNAHTLDWSGNAWYAGDVFVGSTSGTNKDDGSKKLATEEYVNNEIADCIKAPATVEVGQTIVVKAVDETGKPTAWEAADMTDGVGLRLVAKVTTVENVASVEVTGLDINSDVVSVRAYNVGNSCGNGVAVTVNGQKASGYTGSNSGTSEINSCFRFWLYRGDGVWKLRSVHSNGGINVFDIVAGQPINNLIVSSPANDGTTKFYQAGTIIEVYEGVYPNVQ